MEIVREIHNLKLGESEKEDTELVQGLHIDYRIHPPRHIHEIVRVETNERTRVTGDIFVPDPMIDEDGDLSD